MSWTLGKLAASTLILGLLLLMCAGYVGAEGLLGTAVILVGLGFALLIIRVFTKK